MKIETKFGHLNLKQRESNKKFWQEHNKETYWDFCGSKTSPKETKYKKGNCEPNYNEDFCSLGCFKEWVRRNFLDK